MATLLQISQLGNEVLRKKSKPVKNIKSKTVQKLIDDLLDTVNDANGVGIAAPQVYQLLRIFIVASYPNPRYPNAPEMTPTAMINPKILSHSKEIVKDWEGCLSIPGIRGLVPRYKDINVEYTDRKGKKVKAKFENFIARIFQHEYDHLEGITYLERLENTHDIISDKEYQKIIAKSKIKRKK